ncbi:hypothetical protein, partial [Leclercia adecarboxylata]|uniref:hypothetical protein n=1 Tax=Leclercia adecarboxylata TaxID=83655 RepID=UPI00244C1159
IVAPGSRTPLHLPGIKAEPRTARYGVFCRLPEILKSSGHKTLTPAGWRAIKAFLSSYLLLSM